MRGHVTAIALGLAACRDEHDANGSGEATGGGSSSAGDTSGVDTQVESSSGAVTEGRCCTGDGRRVIRCEDGMPLEDCVGGEVCHPDLGGCVDLCGEAEAMGSAIGCEHYAVALPMASGARQMTTGGTCHGVVIANPTPTRAHVRIERDGETLELDEHFARLVGLQTGMSAYGTAVLVVDAEPLDPELGIPPYDAALVPLAGRGCERLMPGFEAVDPDADRDAASIVSTTPGDPVATQYVVAKSGLGHAFRIVSDVPVGVQQFAPFLGAWVYSSGGTTLLPTSRWGAAFVADAPAGTYTSYETSADPGGFNPYVVIVARDDDTRVTLQSTAPIGGGAGVPPTFAGGTLEVELDAGELVQLVEIESLAGSAIEASSPIAVFVGHECASLPEGTGECDHVQQMLPPLGRLDSEYVAIGPSRIGEPAQWRIDGIVDGTTLSYSGGREGVDTLDAGGSLSFTAFDPFVVRSQDDDHPFRLVSMMQSCSALDVVTCPGDVEMLFVDPPREWIEAATFAVDPTFARTQLLVARARDAEPVELDCARDGVVAEWTVVDEDYEIARIDFDVPDTPYDDCEAGMHRLASAAPFAAWVWSWSSGTSIAYPVALGTVPHHDAVPAG
jgi:hypothetical protein